MKSTILGLGIAFLLVMATPGRSDACEGCGCGAKAGKDAPAVFGAPEGGCPHAKAAGEGTCGQGAGGCPAAAAQGSDPVPACEGCKDCPCKKDGTCPCKDGKPCAACKDCPCKKDGTCPCKDGKDGKAGTAGGCKDCPCKKDGTCPCKDGKACAACKDCPCKKDGRCKCSHGGQCPHHSAKQ
ncbi:hypothetical protein KBD49_05135 [Myxococcota bacterium]|nr:hypothetical protein [Myxococcota bacterium]